MALGNATVWEVRTGGSDSNGGGYRADSPLVAPNAPSLSLATTGGKLPKNTTYYIAVTWSDTYGAISRQGPSASVTTASSTNTNKITVTIPTGAPSGATNWNIYMSMNSTGPFWPVFTGQSVSTTTAGVSNSLPSIPTSVNSAPSAPTIGSITTGGTVAAGTYYGVIAYLDSSNAWTAISAATSFTTTGTTSTIQVTPPAQGSNLAWNYFLGTQPNGPFYNPASSITDFSTTQTSTATPSTSNITQARGTDYSQQDAAQLTLTDIVCTNSSYRITSATGGFTPAMVGNIIQLQGTNAGFYEMLSYESSNSAFLDRNLSAQTGTTGNLGGALGLYSASVASCQVAGNKVYIKSGTYTLPSSGNGSGGLTFANISVTPNIGNNAQPLHLIGYASSRSDLGISSGSDNRPIITLTSSAVNPPSLIKFNNSGAYIDNLILDCNSVSNSTGITFASSAGKIENCKVANFTLYGMNLTSSSSCIVIGSEVTGGVSGATAGIYSSSNPITLFGNSIHGNACVGVRVAGVYMFNNFIYSNTGSTSDGVFQHSNTQMVIIGNTIHNNGQYGINMTVSSNNPGHLVKNNLITSNGKHGLALAAAAPGVPMSILFDNNAYYNNFSSTALASQILYSNNQGVSNVSSWVSNDKILTSTPYANEGSGDYTPNTTPLSGQSLRGYGYPTKLPSLSTSTNIDIGAYHSPSSSGSGLAGVSISRIIGGI